MKNGPVPSCTLHAIVLPPASGDGIIFFTTQLTNCLLLGSAQRGPCCEPSAAMDETHKKSIKEITAPWRAHGTGMDRGLSADGKCTKAESRIAQLTLQGDESAYV
eukprot:Skav214131  [mRNA]  locus=scaffold1185:671498:671812:- [translate_table: standard]